MNTPDTYKFSVKLAALLRTLFYNHPRDTSQHHKIVLSYKQSRRPIDPCSERTFFIVSEETSLL